MTKRGKLIVFEGIDGAGKSSQLTRAATYLREGGHAVVVTREPGGTAIGERIRSLLLSVEHENMDAVCELLLYGADRRQHVREVILPALAAGQIVLSDRYTFSTIAYQGYGRDLDAGLIDQINAIATGGLAADMTLIFDVERETAAARLRQGNGGQQDRLEGEGAAFFNRVRRGFLTLAAQAEAPVAVIDGRGDEDTVFDAVRAALGELAL